MAKYKVVEKFLSINGEGSRAGQLAVFIRMKGCNLNCGYCDTRWANDSKVMYDEMTEHDILKYILDSQITNVTLTGGEPLLQKEIGVLFDALAMHKELCVEVETNGSIDLSTFCEMENRPFFTMDYKLPGSGMEDKMQIKNLSLLQKKDAIKFVVSDIHDLEVATELVQTYQLLDRTKVYYSTAFGQIKPCDVVEYMKEKRLNQIHLQLQLHKYIWNPKERGV